ncbi:YhcN/YlaJ family sporulation lipoprotein [Metabacillus herbersteinensis]|uniref:YhcN/YlaJ family sporulation lipoprotein n=1 Tax=Metabacillus herbersteinensis TaxID=283816 RepID=A0ABV6GB78_9BACI
MKKVTLAASVLGLSLLTACQQGATGEKDMLEESGNTINVQDRTDLYNDDGLSNGNDKQTANFGYVRHQKSGVARDVAFTRTPAIDREQAANMISSLCVQLPNVNDIATLVTDEEVLVAYETDAENKDAMADMVKKTAISVIPRYYHVYVSDDQTMISQIESYSRLDSNSRDIDEIINTTIKDMLKSPQGRKLNTGENANGEGYGEMNEELDQDMKDQYEKTRYNKEDKK